MSYTVDNNKLLAAEEQKFELGIILRQLKVSMRNFHLKSNYLKATEQKLLHFHLND